MSQTPSWAIVAQQALSIPDKTPTGSVTSKVEKSYGFSCQKCTWVYIKKETHSLYEGVGHVRQDLLKEGYKRYIAKRCKKHAAQAKRYSRAVKTFVQLDEIRMNEDIKVLRFLTLTHPKWTVIIPFEQCGDIAAIQDAHKRTCLKHWRNWRYQNKWWISRNALGRYWPECVQTVVWNGWTCVGIQLHFHTHSIIVSKYLDNEAKLDYGVKVPDGKAVFQEDSRFHKEWGGIVDVRSVKDYQREYVVRGETRKGCGRKACVNYLTKYITKANHWKSQKIGKW